MHITQTETPDEYHARLCEATNGTPVMAWKTLKGMAYSVGFAAFGVYAIQNGAPPFPTTVAVLAASGAAMVGELAEVEIANLVTLTFKRRKRPAKNEEDD